MIARWILLVPVTLAAFYLCVAAAIGIYMTAEALCPHELVISEQCIAGYMNTTKEALLLIAPAVAAGFMILCASIIAPAHKTKTVLATFVLGSIAAVYYAVESGYWLTLLLTETCAAITTYWLARKHQKKS